MKTCLTVDDSKVLRQAVIKMLKELNISAREAENGIIALQECAKELPDFILLDRNMPEMDGLEFLKAFRKNPANDKVVIIFCTTVNEFSKIEEAINLGANEYIMKPFDKSILRDKLIHTGVLYNGY